MDEDQTPVTPKRPLGPSRAQPNRRPPNPFSRIDMDDTTTASTAPAANSSLAASPKKKKILLMGFIAAAVLILGLGLLYVYWFQNPNKVVSDALMNAVSAKSLTYTGTVATTGATKMTVALDGGTATNGGTVNAKFTFDTQGRQYHLEGSGIIDEKNDLYFKVKNIDDLANNYRSAIPASSQQLFDQIIAKINDKWIKVSSNDLKSYSENLANTQRCVADAAKKLQSDSAFKSQLMDVYEKHPFLTIDKNLGAKDGSLGYTLRSNQDVAKAFTKDYKTTDLYKSLVKCDDSFTVKDDDVVSEAKGRTGDDGRVDVWVSRWTHQITKLTLKSGETTNITLEPTFNNTVSVETPRDATTVEQLQKDVQALLQSSPGV